MPDSAGGWGGPVAVQFPGFLHVKSRSDTSVQLESRHGTKNCLPYKNKNKFSQMCAVSTLVNIIVINIGSLYH